MRIAYEHELELEDVYQRLNKRLSNLQEMYADKIKFPVVEWNPEHTKMECMVEVFGFRSKGRITLHAGQIRMEGNIPLAVRPLRETIEEIVRAELDGILS